MPTKSKKSYSRKKRAYSRRKKAYYRKNKVTRTLTNVKVGKGFPQTMTMTHRYACNENLSSTAGAVVYKTFSCNDLYDPEVAVGGHQPLNRDQCAALYQHYICIGSKITIKIAAVTTGSGGGLTPSIFCLQKHGASAPTYTDPLVLQEQNLAKCVISPASMDSVITLRSGWSAKKTFGKGFLGNDNMQGSSGASPAEQTYWTISQKAMDLTSTSNFAINVVIDYIAIWREAKTTVPS